MRRIPFPGVFKPLSDSRLLAEWIGREPLADGARVLDLCTGSGILAIAAARAGASDVTAVDVSRRAVVAASLNARLNGVRVRTLCGDLFSPVRNERFDLIVSNPPYIPSPTDRLPDHGPARALDAGWRGRIFLDRICAEAADHLTEGGALLLIHSSICSEQTTVEALGRRGLDAAVVVRKPGPLGRVLSARASMLRSRGLLDDDDSEEIVIVRGKRVARSDPIAAPEAPPQLLSVRKPDEPGD
jgi:release factor glutamine methyltransferase